MPGNTGVPLPRDPGASIVLAPAEVNLVRESHPLPIIEVPCLEIMLGKGDTGSSSLWAYKLRLGCDISAVVIIQPHRLPDGRSSSFLIGSLYQLALPRHERRLVGVLVVETNHSLAISLVYLSLGSSSLKALVVSGTEGVLIVSSDRIDLIDRIATNIKKAGYISP